MNKKLLALVMIIIVLSTVFAGCTMFSISEDRDYHQVVATVNYNEMSADVYKGDVLTYVVNYGGQYIQNYGMTPEQVVEYFYNTLSKQKLILLFAKDHVAKHGLGLSAKIESDTEIAKMTNEQFLSVDERRHCIELTNKEFEDLWKENISSLEKEQEINKGSEETKPDDNKDKEDELAPRPLKPAKQASKEYVNGNLTEESLLPTKFPDKAKEDIKKETDKDKQSNMRLALTNLEKDLKKNFTDYNYFYNQHVEARIVEKYQEDLGSDFDPNAIGNALNIRYQKLADIDIAKYVDEDAYAKALESTTFSLYHTNAGYSQVKSILIKFNKTQEDVLHLVSGLATEDIAKKFRNDMALGKVDANNYGEHGAELVAMLEGKDGANGMLVNVSNPKYDAEDKDSVAYTDKNLPMNVVLYAMADSLANKKESMNKLVSTDATVAQRDAALDYATSEAFVDWIYLINDDPGMFKGTNYTITRDGRDSSYVEEYTILGRELAKSGAGSYAAFTAEDNLGTIISDDKALEYKGETELFKDVNGKKATIRVKENVTSKLANDKEIKTDVYTLTTEANNSISFIVNDFGVHIILVEDTIFNDKDANLIPRYKDNDPTKEIVGYQLGLDYVYDQEVKVVYKKDEETGLDSDVYESVTIKEKKIRDYVTDLFKSEFEADKATSEQVEIFTDESLIVKNEKVYKKMVDKLIKG